MTDGDVTPSEGSETATSLSLLERARAGEPSAWKRLCELYEPLVHRWCHRRNLQDADAADIRQEVFAAVSRNLDDFRREVDRGTFRGWLRTITASKIAEFWRKKGRSVSTVGGSDAGDQLAHVATDPGNDEDDQELTAERQVLYRRALEIIVKEFEERTWRAFYRVVVEEGPPADIAEELGMSVGAVYSAKSRVLARLRSEFAGMLDH